MRIVQVISSVAPADGGPTTGALRLNEALSELGHEAVLLATDADGARGRLLAGHQPGFQEDAPIEVFPRSRPLRLKNSWAMARRTFKLARTADVMHIHGGYLANSVWVFLACMLTGTPYTYQLHGVLEPYQRQFGRPHKWVWDSLIGKRILRRAAFLVAASTSEAANLRQLMPETDVVVAPLGVTTIEPPAPSAELLNGISDWLAADPSSRVLFLGRLARKKQPDFLIKAWNQMDVGQLLVVGPEEDWTAEELMALVAPHRAKAVTVTQGVDAETAACLMDQAAIFVLPSLNENFAIAIAEAMAYGCAVVTTVDTAASEHVLAARGGIVLDRGEPSAIAVALTELVREPATTSEFAHGGRRYARTRLTWSSTADILIKGWQGVSKVERGAVDDAEQ